MTRKQAGNKLLSELKEGRKWLDEWIRWVEANGVDDEPDPFPSSMAMDALRQAHHHRNLWRLIDWEKVEDNPALGEGSWVTKEPDANDPANRRTPCK